MNPKRERLSMDGYPASDATADTMWYVITADRLAAVGRDPTQCAIAQAVMRTVGPDGAAKIGRAVAWVKAPDEDGVVCWKRYTVPPKTRDRIIHFDKTGEIDPRGYRLKAPRRGKTLDYEVEREAKRKTSHDNRGSRSRPHVRKEIAVDGTTEATIRNMGGHTRLYFVENDE